MNKIINTEVAKKIILTCLCLIIFLLTNSPVRSTVIIAFLMLYAIVFNILNTDDIKKIKLSKWDWYVIAILGACFVGRLPSFIASDFSARYVSAGLHIAASIPIFFLLKRLINHSYIISLHRVMAMSLAASGVGAGVIAIWQTQILGWKAADGFLYSINFGYMSCVIFSMCLALLPGNKCRWGLAFGGAGALVAVLLSGSRGAIFPLPILMLVWACLNLRTIQIRNAILVIAAIPLLAYSAYISMPMVKERSDIGLSEISSFLQGDFDRKGSFNYRVQLWIGAIEAVKQRPIIGLTYNEREELNQTLVKEGKLVSWVLTINRGHAHSQYFETLATGGLIGVVALFVYLFLPLLFYFKFYLKNRANNYAIAGVLFTLTYMLCGLTEVLLQQEMIAAFYGFMQMLLLLMARHRWIENE